jgi:hypothetical protein
VKKVQRCAVNSQCTRALLHFADGSTLLFEHTSRQNRWARASAPGTDAEETCQTLSQFRLNAKHLELFFVDGSHAEFLPPFSVDSGLT